MCNFGKRWDALSLSCEVAKAQGVTVIQDVGGEDPGLGFMEPAPNHHFYGWYGYHSQSWGVYGIGSAKF